MGPGGGVGGEEGSILLLCHTSQKFLKGGTFFGLTNLCGRGRGSYQHRENIFITYEPSNNIQKKLCLFLFIYFFLREGGGKVLEYWGYCGRTL